MQKIKQHPFIAAGIIIVAIFAFTFAVNKFGLDWTGFNGGYSQITSTSTSQGITTATVKPPGKTLWDWLGLLAALAIPIVVGFGAAWFTTQQGKVSDAENTDNQRETALQAYIDKMSELLLHEKLRDSAEDDEVRMIARVRTLTVLRRLDKERKGSVLQFLGEAGLIDKSKHIIDLSGADLSDADLRAVNLSGVNLSGANISGADLIRANLSDADLSDASLFEADLRASNLIRANLTGANLYGANLSGAKLSGASLLNADLCVAYLIRADLSGADLNRAQLRTAHLFRANLSGASLLNADLMWADLMLANLRGADLTGARLSDADLSGRIRGRSYFSGADLSNAKVTKEQLDTAKSLKGATMPDGSKHP